MSTRLYERRYPEVPGGTQNRSGVSFNRGREMKWSLPSIARVELAARHQRRQVFPLKDELPGREPTRGKKHTADSGP